MSRETLPPKLAVALTYEAPRAPRVVAVGRGWLGEKIIETARAHGVPLREDADLAEALASIELESEVPEALYRAVAAVIAFVLKANAAAETASASRPPGDRLRKGQPAPAAVRPEDADMQDDDHRGGGEIGRVDALAAEQVLGHGDHEQQIDPGQ